MEKKRSAGILTLGIFALLYGLVYFHRTPDDSDISYILSFLYALCWIISAIAVMRFKNWGRVLLIVISVYDFFKEIILGRFQPSKAIKDIVDALILLLEALILIVFVIFLTRPKVREQFK